MGVAPGSIGGAGVPGGASGVGAITIVNRAAVLAVANGALTYVPWDSVRENVPGWFAAGTPDRITVNVAGIYVVHWESAWDASLIGNRFHHMERIRAADGIQEVLGAYNRAATQANATGGVAWAGRLLAGDAIRCAVFQDSGGAINWGGFNRSAGNPVGSSTNAELSVLRVA